MFPFVTLPQMFLNHTQPGFTHHLSHLIILLFFFISESLHECAAGSGKNLRAATLWH